MAFNKFLDDVSFLCTKINPILVCLNKSIDKLKLTIFSVVKIKESLMALYWLFHPKKYSLQFDLDAPCLSDPCKLCCGSLLDPISSYELDDPLQYLHNNKSKNIKWASIQRNLVVVAFSSVRSIRCLLHFASPRYSFVVSAVYLWKPLLSWQSHYQLLWWPCLHRIISWFSCLRNI